VSPHTERSQIGVREKTSPGTHRFWIRELANSETPIRERTVVLWTSRSHEKGVSQRELRSGERYHRGSGIGDP
jgi:hypothetical protein